MKFIRQENLDIFYPLFSDFFNFYVDFDYPLKIHLHGILILCCFIYFCNFDLFIS